MFYGCECVFNGISCRNFGLMVYDFGDNTQDEISHTSTGKILSDHVPGRNGNYLYGIDRQEPLSFRLILCANEEAADRGEFFDRFDIAAISGWLTGHQTWKYLSISQPDMEDFRYKCVITELTTLTHGSVPWAFSCTVTCDSPYAYLYPEIRSYKAIPSGTTVAIRSRSTCRDLYYPVIELTKNSAAHISARVAISNITLGREFVLEQIPTSATRIHIDGSRQLITDETSGINLYKSFNRVFFPLTHGPNQVRLTGDFTAKFICEYPVDIGG